MIIERAAYNRRPYLLFCATTLTATTAAAFLFLGELNLTAVGALLGLTASFTLRAAFGAYPYSHL